MKAFIVIFFYSFLLKAEPYSCELELSKNIWPRDCLVYLYISKPIKKPKPEIKDLFKRVENWCVQNSNKTIKKKSYLGFKLGNNSIPKACKRLITKSEEFHEFRRLNNF